MAVPPTQRASAFSPWPPSGAVTATAANPWVSPDGRAAMRVVGERQVTSGLGFPPMVTVKVSSTAGAPVTGSTEKRGPKPLPNTVR